MSTNTFGMYFNMNTNILHFHKSIRVRILLKMYLNTNEYEYILPRPDYHFGKVFLLPKHINISIAFHYLAVGYALILAVLLCNQRLTLNHLAPIL